MADPSVAGQRTESVGSELQVREEVPHRSQASTRERAGRWMLDWLNPWHYAGYEVRREIVCCESEFQRIEIVETTAFGRSLLLGGEVQSFEADEHIYHEALVHPALLAHPHPVRVLIIGGGEGATLREVLRHGSVERVLMVDVDREVVEASRRYLPTFHEGAFSDPRVELVIGDGRDFVEGSLAGGNSLERNDETFDVILIDINSPLDGGPSCRLFTREFYEAVKGRLASDHGLVALQSGGATMNGLEGLSTIARTLGSVFDRVFPAAVFVPSFAMDWSFTLAGDGCPSPLEAVPHEVDAELEARLESGLRFYDGIGHVRMFHLPRFVRQALRKSGKMSLDTDLYLQPFPGCTDDRSRSTGVR